MHVYLKLSLFVIATWSLGPVNAQDRSGQTVVETVCAACHASGKDGAPLIGDFAAWAKRAQNGFGKLTENAIAGTGKMPSHGGQPNLSDLEVSRAIAFMASGGRAPDPSKPYASPSSITGERLVGSHCVSCHGAGKDGAPRINVFSDWKPRLRNGIAALVDSAIKGHNAMPARSGLNSLSDSDLRNAVTYMVVQSAAHPGK